MKNLLPWTAAALALLLLSGCSKKSDDSASMQETTPEQSTETQDFDPSRDPARGIDEAFLVDQARKRAQIEKTIQAYWSDEAGDPKVVRKLILTRKGEILTTKRNIRKSRLFTDAQKDSLIAPLDEESVNLSRELVALSDN